MNELIKKDGIIILPNELMLEKEKSVLVYILNEDNKSSLEEFCNLWSKGKHTKTGACNKSGISPSTVNRILKYAKIGEDFCEEHGIDHNKTNYKHVIKAAKAIRKSQTRATEKLTDLMYGMAEEGNFNAAKFLAQKINPEEFGDQATENSLSNLNNSVAGNNNTINIQVMGMNEENIKKMSKAQEKLYLHAKKLRDENKKENEQKLIGNTYDQ